MPQHRERYIQITYTDTGDTVTYTQSLTNLRPPGHRFPTDSQALHFALCEIDPGSEYMVNFTDTDPADTDPGPDDRPRGQHRLHALTGGN